MKVLLFGDYYLSWTGGANLLGYLVRAIHKGCEVTGGKLHFAVSNRFLADPSICKDGYARVPRAGIEPAGVFETFLAECDCLQEIYFVSDLNQMIEREGINIVGPSGIPLGSLQCPWLGYIPDFQHQYLPEFFSNDERASRDAIFRQIVEQSDGIYVNSRAVMDDVENFYPGFFPPKKVMKLPPLLANVNVNSSSLHLTKAKFDLKKNYFISCSQRWMHKQHELIVEAFRLFCERHIEFDFDLVFTGSLTDYRNQDYGRLVSQKITQSGVAEKIKVLGLIDRKEQINLISHSACLVQASLFEGGPGASGMQEAALLAKVVVASDIRPNLEFNEGRILYFRVRDVEDLYARMAKVANEIYSSNVPNVPDQSKTEYARNVRDVASGLQLLDEFKYFLLNRN